MNAGADYSREAVERLAHGCDHFNGNWMIENSAEIAATLRALRAALDAAERERDEARSQLSDVLAENDALRFTLNNARLSDATGYARCVRDAALIAETHRADAEHHMRRAKEDCHSSEEQHQSGRWHASNDIEEDILALLTATKKETRDDQ